MRRRVLGYVLPLCLLMAACATDGNGPMDPEPDPDPEVQTPMEIDGIVVENTTAAETLTAFGAAHEAKSLAAYTALITDGFEFHIRDDDADAFPWLSDDFWGRATELGMIANMFDPAFSGSNPPVDSIDFDQVILSQRDLSDTDNVVIAVEITADATVTVLTGPNDGFLSDTRLVVELVEDADGFFRVDRVDEVEKLGPARAEDSSFGSIKSLYR
ncbi:MAG: hypothetical protein HKN12_01090 [Gemmatimonadetes bacterium]|nr:hypothetical protein [Gemmatimonadota bacterium]